MAFLGGFISGLGFYQASNCCLVFPSAPGAEVFQDLPVVYGNIVGGYRHRSLALPNLALGDANRNVKHRVSNQFYLGIGDPLKSVIGRQTLLLASVGIFVPIVYALLVRWKAAPTYQLAAVPAVFSTFWMSHRNHDLMIVSLLAVPLFSLALRQQHAKIIIVMVLIAYCFPHFAIFYGEAYLWPAPFPYLWPVPFLFRITWLLGLIYLLEPIEWDNLRLLKTM